MPTGKWLQIVLTPGLLILMIVWFILSLIVWFILLGHVSLNKLNYPMMYLSFMHESLPYLLGDKEDN